VEGNNVNSSGYCGEGKGEREEEGSRCNSSGRLHNIAYWHKRDSRAPPHTNHFLLQGKLDKRHSSCVVCMAQVPPYDPARAISPVGPFQ